MTNTDPQMLIDQFRDALADCKELYVSSARDCIEQHPNLLPGTPNDFLRLMIDLHKGLLIKVYVTISEADRQWHREERVLAEILFEHVWKQQFDDDRLRKAARQIFQDAARLKWYSLIRPFDQFAPLRGRIAQLDTVVMRVANLVAKADGRISKKESQRLQTIQDELDRHLRPIPIDQPGHHEQADVEGSEAMRKLPAEARQLREKYELKTTDKSLTDTATQGPSLEEALRELDQLIGLDSIKQEVRSLTNFLKLQRDREQAGLPQSPISLHMALVGNPGTGKTTVARIIGRIFRGLGILKKGHLVETDRSGLVAQYAGQTGPKTNKKIDESLDGVLFIDEAYSLVAPTGDDPYGHEAVQALLKRMEDDRDRLVVILAGYPEPVERLLKSNPGLSSRVTTTFQFDDYSPGELGQIFQVMCDTNHYVVPADTQVQLLLGFQWLHDQRDEHFGNGRLVRNAFERAIRRLANRISGIAPLTKELLTVLTPADIDLPDVPAAAYEAGDNKELRFTVHCPGCSTASDVPPNFLGRQVKCNTCQHQFQAAWGEPALDAS